jgi:adenylate cyclase
MDYTIIGDSVNVAARLQSLARSGEILITASAYALLSDPVEAQPRPSTKLRGRDQRIDLFSIIADR